jgi:hypothetical protein
MHFQVFEEALLAGAGDPVVDMSFLLLAVPSTPAELTSQPLALRPSDSITDSMIACLLHKGGLFSWEPAVVRHLKSELEQFVKNAMSSSFLNALGCTDQCDHGSTNGRVLVTADSMISALESMNKVVYGYGGRGGVRWVDALHCSILCSFDVLYLHDCVCMPGALVGLSGFCWLPRSQLCWHKFTVVRGCTPLRWPSSMI